MEFIFNFFTILIKYFGHQSASLAIDLHDDEINEELTQFFAFNS